MEIIGQDEAKRELDRIFKIFKNSKAKIRPHFLLTGSSGSGKSVILKYLAEKNEMSFMEINGAQLTKEGTSGNSLSKALTPLLEVGDKLVICFVDEFDKLFISGNSNSQLAHETTNGVQNEFLKVLESDTASVFHDYGKYIQASTKNVLFVFAGAFNGEADISIDRLRELGIKTEFLGRVGLVFNMKDLTLENLYEILDQSPLLESYLELFKDKDGKQGVDGDKVKFEIKEHLAKIFQENTLGARVISTLIHQYFIHRGLKKEIVEKVTFQDTLTFDD